MRKAIIEGPVEDVIGPDGAKYTNISRYPGDEVLSAMREKIGSRIEPVLSFARFDMKGELPHNFCHADTICADYAALLYLNKWGSPVSGTAFWRHTEYGCNALTGQSETDLALERDWNDHEKWEMDGFVKSDFNRLIVYPTKVFHSRYPHEAFGTTKEDARLVWICFFN